MYYRAVFIMCVLIGLVGVPHVSEGKQVTPTKANRKATRKGQLRGALFTTRKASSLGNRKRVFIKLSAETMAVLRRPGGYGPTPHSLLAMEQENARAARRARLEKSEARKRARQARYKRQRRGTPGTNREAAPLTWWELRYDRADSQQYRGTHPLEGDGTHRVHVVERPKLRPLALQRGPKPAEEPSEKPAADVARPLPSPPPSEEWQSTIERFSSQQRVIVPVPVGAR
jgi:hypothetical protein